MKLAIFAALAALAVAAPTYSEPEAVQSSYGGPAASVRDSSFQVVEVVPILRDDRVMEEDGRYTLDVETGNGIIISQSGAPEGPDGSIIKAGSYSYTAPDGTYVEMKFVADENGFQPESPLLPVAPEFPHPIPQFVLEQIEFAREEDAARARAEASNVQSLRSDPAPSYSYGSPQ